MPPCWAEGWARLSCTWPWTAPVCRHSSIGCPFSQPRTGQPAGEPGTRGQGLHVRCCYVILVAEAEKHSRTRAVWSCPLWKLRLGWDPQEHGHTCGSVMPSSCYISGFWTGEQWLQPLRIEWMPPQHTPPWALHRYCSLYLNPLPGTFSHVPYTQMYIHRACT